MSRTPRSLLRSALDWFRGQGDGAVIRNATSLVGVTVTTAGLGAVYWALAARTFPPAAIGIAAAGLSTLMLVGQISTVGLGTVLMGELSRHRGAERPMIYTGVGIAALVGAVVGLGVIVSAAHVVPELATLRAPVAAAIFAIGAGGTAAGLVLDQAMLGLLRGGLQLVRNTVASVAKLAALAVIGLGVVAIADETALLATWVFGTLVSMGLLVVVHRIAGPGTGDKRFEVPSGLPALAARHHLLNLSILAPGLLMPLVVTAVTSAEENAYFYIAYLIAGFAWAGPSALATALYAAGSRDVHSLGPRVRLSLLLSMAGGVALNLFMIVGAGPLLTIFGETYADRAETLLRILSLGMFPVTINSLFVPIARIERRFLQGTVLMVLSMAIEFAFVVAGGILGGLEGLAYGWLIGNVFGIIPLVPTVYRIAVRNDVRVVDHDRFGALRALGGAPVAAGGDGKDSPVPVRPAKRGGAPSPLSVALLTDGPRLSRWEAACASAMIRSGVIELEWFHDGRTARRGPRPAALAPAANDIPSEMPAPRRLTGQDHGDFAFDLLLDLRTGESGPPALSLPATRRWAFRFGADRRRDPVRVGLREIVLGRGTTEISLVDCDTGRALRGGVLRTAGWSIDQQFDQLLLDTAPWPAREASRLVAGTPARPVAKTASVADGSVVVGATPMPLLWLAARARQIGAVSRPFAQHDDWNVGLLDWPIADVLAGADVAGVTWLPRRPGRYAADPFGIERSGRLHIFFEDFDVRLGRAVISASTLEADGTLSDPEPVVDAGCHASYPFLLEADGEVWMIPETTAARQLRLYRAVDLPGTWELERILLSETQVSDPTIVRGVDRWWLFGTSRQHGTDHALRLWHAPAITGPWEIHPEDPVKLDARSARPGGTPFTVGGRLYRPAQDCSSRYGGRVVINRVDVLTPDEFREVPVASISPRDPYPNGLHTLSAVGRRTLVDGNAARFVPEAVPAQVRRRLAAS